jgi:hypothetical protein
MSPFEPLQNEVFASRHQDQNSVACIEEKCYVLTFAEYCRSVVPCTLWGHLGASWDSRRDHILLWALSHSPAQNFVPYNLLHQLIFLEEKSTLYAPEVE